MHFTFIENKGMVGLKICFTFFQLMKCPESCRADKTAKDILKEKALADVYVIFTIFR